MKITPLTAKDLKRITCPGPGAKLVKEISQMKPREVAISSLTLGSVFLLNKVLRSQGVATFYSIKEPAFAVLKKLPQTLEFLYTKFSTALSKLF